MNKKMVMMAFSKGNQNSALKVYLISHLDYLDSKIYQGGGACHCMLTQGIEC